MFTGFYKVIKVFLLQYLQGKPCDIYRLQENLIVIIGFSLQILQKNL